MLQFYTYFFATKTTTKALRQAEIANVLEYWLVVALSEELCNSWWTWNWTENSIIFFMVDLKSKGKENNLDIPRERSLNKSTFEISDVTAGYQWKQQENRHWVTPIYTKENILLKKAKVFSDSWKRKNTLWKFGTIAGCQIIGIWNLDSWE